MYKYVACEGEKKKVRKWGSEEYKERVREMVWRVESQKTTHCNIWPKSFYVFISVFYLYGSHSFICILLSWTYLCIQRRILILKEAHEFLHARIYLTQYPGIMYKPFIWIFMSFPPYLLDFSVNILHSLEKKLWKLLSIHLYWYWSLSFVSFVNLLLSMRSILRWHNSWSTLAEARLCSDTTVISQMGRATM